MVLYELTRPLGWGSQHVGWLGELHGGLRGTTWLQLGTGVVCTVVLAMVVFDA